MAEECPELNVDRAPGSLAAMALMLRSALSLRALQVGRMDWA